MNSDWDSPIINHYSPIINLISAFDINRRRLEDVALVPRPVFDVDFIDDLLVLKRWQIGVARVKPQRIGEDAATGEKPHRYLTFDAIGRSQFRHERHFVLIVNEPRAGVHHEQIADAVAVGKANVAVAVGEIENGVGRVFLHGAVPQGVFGHVKVVEQRLDGVVRRGGAGKNERKGCE